jgi:hypothetical protein
MDNLGYELVKVASPGFVSRPINPLSFPSLCNINTCHPDIALPLPQGSAANSFLDLINVDELNPKHSIPHGLHRSKDPGAGAFSTYHDRQSVARVDIQQGEEFFVDYGADVSNRYLVVPARTLPALLMPA